MPGAGQPAVVLPGFAASTSGGAGTTSLSPSTLTLSDLTGVAVLPALPGVAPQVATAPGLGSTTVLPAPAAPLDAPQVAAEPEPTAILVAPAAQAVKADPLADLLPSAAALLLGVCALRGLLRRRAPRRT